MSIATIVAQSIVPAQPSKGRGCWRKASRRKGASLPPALQHTWGPARLT